MSPRTPRANPVRDKEQVGKRGRKRLKRKRERFINKEER
jgi:hypothetical protein